MKRAPVSGRAEAGEHGLFDRLPWQLMAARPCVQHVDQGGQHLRRRGEHGDVLLRLRAAFAVGLEAGHAGDVAAARQVDQDVVRVGLVRLRRHRPKSGSHAPI